MTTDVAAANPPASTDATPWPGLDAPLEVADPEVAEYIAREVSRQQDTLEMIASENFASVAAMQAQGSVLTNKYAEGYPGRRYYGGCENVDVIETLAIERLKALFGAGYANVQPHSGAQANAAAMQALIKPGDTILGLSLAHGGHLTHGMRINFSGLLYNVAAYEVSKEDYRIDMDEVSRLARQYSPKLIIAGWSAYPRQLDFERFREIADEVDAFLLVDMAHFAGLVATGLHPSPVPHAHVTTTTTHKTLGGPRGGAILSNDPAIAKKINSAVFPGQQGGPLEHVIAAKAVAFREAAHPSFRTYAAQIVANADALARALAGEGFRLVSGGTDNHLMLVDLRPAGITGKDAQNLLEKVGITTNKNAIPADPESPFVTSGIRVGSPAVTTRGFTEGEAHTIGCLIAQTVFNRDDEAKLADIKVQVQTLLEKHPLYPEL